MHPTPYFSTEDELAEWLQKDPDACNVYRDLEFPPDVYEHIEDFHLHTVHQDEE